MPIQGGVCTLILLSRPGAAWPLLVAANRDEMLARPWKPPAAHWPDQPGVVGGQDTLAGGTWLAMNEAGVIAGVLNRAGSLGPADGRASRGALPLIALRHKTSSAAARAIAGLDGAAFRPFNLVVADAAGATFLKGLGEGPVQARPLGAGLHMVTASDPNDPSHPRVARHLARWRETAPPVPPDWGAWPALLADGRGAWTEALNVPPMRGFGTASAALLAAGVRGERAFLFAPGPPDRVPFCPVEMPALP